MKTMKTKINKPRKMWATVHSHPANHGIMTPIYHAKIPELDQTPVLVIPLDPESLQALREKAHSDAQKAIVSTDEAEAWDSGTHAGTARLAVEATLADLGVPVMRARRGKR